MNVIVVNESRGKAYVRARRILGKYLPQIARRAWAGRISQEGLRDLHAELRGSASKSTAVVCWRIATRRRIEPVFIVGSRKQFDDQGRFAFRAKRVGERVYADPLFQLVKRIGRLAALFHDLGKASAAFQRKLLLKRAKGEPLRHELLSALIVLQAADPASTTSKDGAKRDICWLKLLSETPECIATGITADSLLSEPYRNRAEALARGFENKTASEVLSYYKSSPVLGAVLWLVLTHHRHVGTRDTSASLIASYVNEGMGEQALVDNLRPARGKAPWQETAWLGAVRRTAKSILKVLEAHPKLEQQLRGENLALLLTHFAHPILVYADRAASVHKSTPGRPLHEAKDGAEIYANTRRPWRAHDSDEPILTGDTLSQHLRSTARWSGDLYALYRDQREYFPRTNFPESSPVRQKAPAGRSYDPFRWQDDAAAAVRRAIEAAPGPAFISVVAETGSGKTLGAAKLLHALNVDGTVRYTVALGRRSLTSETGTVLRELAGLSSEECAVVVGDSTQMKIAALEKPPADETANLLEARAEDLAPAAGLAGVPIAIEENEGSALPALAASCAQQGRTEPPALEAAMAHHGSESLITLSYDGVEGEAVRGAWIEALGGAAADIVGGPKTLRLIDVPVLACTVDHLVPAVQWLRSSDTAAALRLFTSDLVLDEIDDYNAQDLVAVAKLVFETARNGHSVIVMSATASSILIEELQRAWVKGFELYRLLMSYNESPHVFAISNLISPAELPVDVAAFASEYRAYIEAFCAEIAKAPARRSTTRRPIALKPSGIGEEAEASLFSQVLRAARAAHQLNHELSPEGIRVSVGAVRFRTTRNAMQFAQYLFNRDDSTDSETIRVCVYHSRMPLLIRNTIEKRLREMLTRKEPGALFRNPIVQSALESCRTRDLMILIVTTSIIETGRDFDIDYGVYEPSSLRGLIQFAGRLRRHRRDEWRTPNLFLLGRPIDKALERPNAKNWGRPGVEDNPRLTLFEHPTADQRPLFSAASISFAALPKGGAVDQAQLALPMAALNACVDSVPALLPPDAYESCRLGAMELVDLHHRLCGPLDDEGRPVTTASFRTYLTDYGSRLPVCLTDRHVRSNPFRARTGTDIEAFLNPEIDEDLESPQYLDVRGIENELPLRMMDVAHQGRVLFDWRAEALADFEHLCRTGEFGGHPYRLLFGARLPLYADIETYEAIGGEFHPLLGYRLEARKQNDS